MSQTWTAQNTTRDILGTALKNEGMLAAMFYRRANNLADPLYDFDPKKQYLTKLSLGPFHPNKLQLFFAVYVGHKGGSVFGKRKGSSNAIHRIYSRFRVSVVWSFFVHPSDTAADFYTADNSHERMKHFAGQPGFKEFTEDFSKGIEARDIHEDFLFFRTKLRDMFFEKLANTYTDERKRKAYLDIQRDIYTAFLSSGLTPSTSYIREIKKYSL